ncbi:sugar ABC transporter permease [Actinotalea sp. K2]|nr:sugar ABC transporter permease [Actinotalea sp. K2]
MSSQPGSTKTPGRVGRRRNGLFTVLFAAPALAWFSLFLLVPLLGVFWLSTQDWSGLLASPSFNGLDNYRTLLDDPSLASALRNTAVQVVVELVIVTAGGYMLGYYIALRGRLSGLVLTLGLVPILTSASARALMFVGVLQPQGLLNGLLRAVGLDALAQPWLGSPSTTLGVIIAVDIWGALGFTAVMVSARLANLSGEVREAARLDGASEWTIMWRVALPIITPFVGALAILHFMWALMASAQNVLLLTNGGPGTSSMNLAYMMYEAAFITNQLGYSQAIGVLLIVLGIAGMAIIRALSKDRT